MTTDNDDIAESAEARQQITLREAAQSSIRIADGLSLPLPNGITFSNLAETNPVFARHLDQVVYRPRIAKLDPIDLVRLPIGTTVVGGGHFLTLAGDALLKEQYPPYIGTFVPPLSDLLAVKRSRETVPGEKLLVARFGISTWGHWVGELLPKMLLVEQAFPNRFHYAVPRHAVSGEHPNSIWSSIQDSMTVCGISPDRMFPLDEEVDHVFDSLFAVSPVWSDHMIHPAATDALRRAVQHVPPDGPSKLAIVRDPWFRRCIANADDVYRLLGAAGYTVEPTGLRRFVEQVARFKAATSIFGVLGSDLTNLVFSPSGVKLLSAAPDIFGDRFFYALVLDRAGTMADLRGAVVQQDQVEHKSTFNVDLATLAPLLND